VGLVLFITGLVLLIKTPAPLLKASDYGVIVHSPRSGETVDVVEVAGTIKKMPPKDYKLMIFRIYPDLGRAIYLLREVDYLEDGKWIAKGCDIGGKTGNNRSLGVYLVGKSGQALFKYSKRATDVQKETGKPPGANNLAFIYEDERTEDMIMCK
jgi:hypothetical protein